MTFNPTRPALLAVLVTLAGGRAAAQDANMATMICLAPTKVESSGSAAVAADAARETFTTYLSGPSLATQPLQARLESQAKAEGKLLGCPFVLFTTIKHEQKQQGGGLLGRIAAGAVQQGAAEVGAASGSTAGRIIGSAASGAASKATSNYAQTVRNKDEITLGYRLESSDGRVLLEKRSKRTSKSDGEDLLTPLVQDASELIVAAAQKKG